MTTAERRNVHRFRTYLTRTYGRGVMNHLAVHPPITGSTDWRDCYTTDARVHRQRGAYRTAKITRPARKE